MRSPRCEFRLCVWHAGVWHTDGRTDRQTESMRQHTASLRWSTHVRSVARWKRHKCINCVNKEHWLATEGATLAVRRVQNPVQAGSGDVHNPHTPLSRLPRRFCAGVQQWSGTDSSPLGVKQRLHCFTDKNETWRQSLLCGRSSCMEQSTSSSSWSWHLAFVQTQAQKRTCLLCVLMTD